LIDVYTDQEVVEKTIHTNYYGVLETTQDLLPLIRPGGRLVNLASMVGQVGKYSKPLQQRFLAVSSIAEATSLMDDFKKAVAEDKIEENGWTAAAYAASKAGVIALTHAIAQDEAKAGRGILVNSCCPGWVQTDMTKGKGLKTTDQGAETPVMLALGDIDDQFGKFWQNEKVISKV
jgi:carbonyl reductase 1